ncbi:MAG: hypothetical protein M3371_04035 [Acidobacteriota bacterium]|nr:hypothetical protein [Acidobacteriota bacterium]
MIFEGVTQGTLGAQERIAPATGYISFFTLALYVAGLILLPPTPEAISPREISNTAAIIDADHRLSPGERVALRDTLTTEERNARAILEDE